MANILCLGTGLVGSFVVKRLADNGHKVTAHDLVTNKQLLGHENILMEAGNVLEKLGLIIEEGGYDLVVNMLPGNIGHEALKVLCEYDVRVVDLSFSEITPNIVMSESRNKKATILWDVGIAPGLSNMLLAKAYKKLGNIKIGEIKVGGNPSEKFGVWNYMAPFSPSDVIAEYTRPARVIRDYKQITLEALTERHIISVDGKGEMEAFLTDGLRSVLYSIPAEELSEYTVRWPGHIQEFIDRRDQGILDYDELLDEWKYDNSKKEFTWLEVIASNDNEKMKWIVSDEGASDGHSMARSTGLVTVFCVEEWLADLTMLTKGVHAPEDLKLEVIDRIINKMKLNKVSIIYSNI